MNVNKEQLKPFKHFTKLPWHFDQNNHNIFVHVSMKSYFLHSFDENTSPNKSQLSHMYMYIKTNEYKNLG